MSATSARKNKFTHIKEKTAQAKLIVEDCVINTGKELGYAVVDNSCGRGISNNVCYDALVKRLT